jgi:DNA primase
MPWTAYLNDGNLPRGSDFIRTVKELAERAGVNPGPLDYAQPVDRRADPLHAFFQLCQCELAGERGAQARAYLERRGFPPEAIPSTALGVVPSAIASGRHIRYLYLKGATRTNLPPYGLSDLLAGTRDGRRELVLVEGVLDLHQLRARGMKNIAALGGTALSPQTFERLHEFGVETVILCLDNDDPGRSATARAVEHVARARHSRDLYVVDPERLAPANDPDALIRMHGTTRWKQRVEAPISGVAWRAHEFAGTVRPDSPAPDRRAALARAARRLGTLPPRLALEQEDAIHAIAERCGYSSGVVTRSFRARFWIPPQRERQPSRPPTNNRALGLQR